jgi:hypothetical protein
MAMTTSALGHTSAYFSSAATTSANTLSTVSLSASASPGASALFNVPSNLVPGDFAFETFDLVNGGTAGVPQQDVTYALTSAVVGACSRLDSTDPPTCSHAAAPSAAPGSGAALLLLRCTSDASAAVPLACATPGVYVTQVYPASGAGTQQQLASGLNRSAFGSVATGTAYSIALGGTAFTGGPLLIASPFGVGGPAAVPGADGQLRGLASGQTDHLASVVYLPTQSGDALANQSSLLTFTWTATQRLGTTRS